MRAAVVGLVAIAAVLAAMAGLLAANHPQTGPQPRTSAPTSAAPPAPPGLPATLPADPNQLAADLNQAQAIIDDPASPSAKLAGAGWFEQLATLTLGRAPPAAQRRTLSRLDRQASATMHANLTAGAALARLVPPLKSLPHWKVVQPPSPDTLLGYFKGAQAHFGVSWPYLAAVEFIETHFGRVAGLSSAGAQGPMQFLPATWARYGRGNVEDPRAAIFGAARYLVANGAPRDMAGALYHYNQSADYVSAVFDYARRMRADPAAYYGYYYQRVIVARAGGPVVLPVGYPKVRSVPLPRGPRIASVASSGTPPK